MRPAPHGRHPARNPRGEGAAPTGLIGARLGRQWTALPTQAPGNLARGPTFSGWATTCRSSETGMTLYPARAHVPWGGGQLSVHLARLDGSRTPRPAVRVGGCRDRLRAASPRRPPSPFFSGAGHDAGGQGPPLAAPKQTMASGGQQARRRAARKNRITRRITRAPCPRSCTHRRPRRPPHPRVRRCPSPRTSNSCARLRRDRASTSADSSSSSAGETLSRFVSGRTPSRVSMNAISAGRSS